VRNHIKNVEFLSKLLDSQFKIGNFKFGLDPLLGIMPFSGDLIGLGLSFYIFWIAHSMKLPFHVRTQMIGNILLDFFIGIIPIIGDAADFVFKANTKNLELLRKYAPSDVIEGQIV
jgi:hypothetical protein